MKNENETVQLSKQIIFANSAEIYLTFVVHNFGATHQLAGQFFSGIKSCRIRLSKFFHSVVFRNKADDG
jgi:hypothetical protein